jgi:hypothetical protein
MFLRPVSRSRFVSLISMPPCPLRNSQFGEAGSRFIRSLAFFSTAPRE